MVSSAVELAAREHTGQTDKAGNPYILHPLRVMQRMSTPIEMTVAVLHDVVEDGEMTIESLLAEGWPQEVVAAIDCLTKRENEAYPEFISRASSNPTARKVKIADIADNLLPSRLKLLPDDVQAKLRVKYEPMLARLLNKMYGGPGCHLQFMKEIKSPDQLTFETVERWVNKDHEDLYVCRCTECGQLYLAYFCEIYIDGDDDCWSFWAPASVEEIDQYRTDHRGAVMLINSRRRLTHDPDGLYCWATRASFILPTAPVFDEGKREA